MEASRKRSKTKALDGKDNPLKFVVISDTHNKHREIVIPDGDVLIHAGDFTSRGQFDQIDDFSDFLGSLPHKHKIVIAGNHDMTFETRPEEARARLKNCIYLQDSSVTIEGVKIYGSPWQPVFFNWAFNLPRGGALREKWESIPEDTDILVTHGPPMGILDQTARGECVGCQDLRDIVEKRQPAYHLFGHIHEAVGQFATDTTHFINASICTLRYEPTNPAVVFDWEQK